MKIGELAKRTGMATSKIRFYESAGLLGDVQRKENGFRTYDEQSLVTLTFIQDAQKAGFDLVAIRNMLPQQMPIPKSERAQQQLLKRLEERVKAIESVQVRLKQQRSDLLATAAHVQERLAKEAGQSPKQQSLI
ncbi:MAG: hypothetical protein RL357_1635 [Pseudomonadota bacterium]